MVRPWAKIVFWMRGKLSRAFHTQLEDPATLHSPPVSTILFHHAMPSLFAHLFDMPVAQDHFAMHEVSLNHAVRLASSYCLLREVSELSPPVMYRKYGSTPPSPSTSISSRFPSVYCSKTPNRLVTRHYMKEEEHDEEY